MGTSARSPKLSTRSAGAIGGGYKRAAGVLSTGNAENAKELLSTTYAFDSNLELDQLVPQPLAEHLCSGRDCVVTRNFSFLEPGIFARKYYARGIGFFFLEVNPETGDVLSLVKYNFDPKYTGLPPVTNLHED